MRCLIGYSSHKGGAPKVYTHWTIPYSPQACEVKTNKKPPWCSAEEGKYLPDKLKSHAETLDLQPSSYHLSDPPQKSQAVDFI